MSASPGAAGRTQAVGRYAPSPSGRLHLGNARTALLSWLQIRALGGRYIMRVEDLDTQRCKPAFERAMLEDLQWLGLDWDEGPDVDGPQGPYRQSQCAELYAEAARQLDTYPCTCTRKELREAVRAPHGATPVYPGTCRNGPSHPERSAALRVRVEPGPGSVVHFDDAIAGPQCESIAEAVGDFAVRRSDGAWAYQLAVVVDDARMGVTHVLRGADLLDSTARQCWLQAQLGYARPHYAHAPLVLGPDGNKLNKRHGAPDLGQLREAKVAPEKVVAALARSCGLVPADCESIAASELVGEFELSKLVEGATALELASLR